MTPEQETRLAVACQQLDSLVSELEGRISVVEEQVDHLLKGRPGRRLQPIIRSEHGVCGIDPERDSASCPDASLWRRAKGCQGDACVVIASEYYRNYRAKKRNSAEEDA